MDLLAVLAYFACLLTCLKRKAAQKRVKKEDIIDSEWRAVREEMERQRE